MVLTLRLYSERPRRVHNGMVNYPEQFFADIHFNSVDNVAVKLLYSSSFSLSLRKFIMAHGQS